MNSKQANARNRTRSSTRGSLTRQGRSNSNNSKSRSFIRNVHGINNSAVRHKRSMSASHRINRTKKSLSSAGARKKKTKSITGRLNKKKKSVIGSKNNNNNRRRQQSKREQQSKRKKFPSGTILLNRYSL